MKKDGEWVDKGYKGTVFNVATPFLNSGHEHNVENSETGEERSIQVNSNQTLEDAVQTGSQWVKEENDFKSGHGEQKSAISGASQTEDGFEDECTQIIDSSFSGEDIFTILSVGDFEAATVQKLFRPEGITEFVYYQLQARYGGMTLRQIKRMRRLEAENAELKNLVTEQKMAIDNWKFLALEEGRVRLSQ